MSSGDKTNANGEFLADKFARHSGEWEAGIASSGEIP
jgi:hypothetical protein